MGLYKAQFISMLIMVSLGIAIFVGFNMEWYSIEVNTSDFFEATGYADYRIVSEKGFSADELDKILHMSGVENAARYFAATVDIKERSGDSVSLSVTGDENVSGFMLISGEKYDPESKDGIWLSDKYAAANDISLGDNLTLTYKGIEFRGIVRGLIKSGEHMICVRDSSQLMPDFSTFGYAYISPAMYETAIGFDYYPQINVISEAEKNEFIENVDKTLGNIPPVLTKDETISYSGAKGESEEGQTMGSILPVLFLLIAVLTMVTTMHRLTAKEKNADRHTEGARLQGRTHSASLHLICVHDRRHRNCDRCCARLRCGVLHHESRRYDGHIYGFARMEALLPVVLLHRTGRYTHYTDGYRFPVCPEDASRHRCRCAQTIFAA